jgi:uncharacterized membrane protein
MMNNWGGMGSGGWIIALPVLVVVIAAIAAIVYLVRGMGTGGTGAGSTTADQPARIAAGRPQRRYSAGEIDCADYEQKLRDLNS